MEEKAERSSQRVDPELPGLVFLGTPDFAVPSLRKLAAAGASILMVVTQPDRPKGRGKKLTPSPVKILAEELNIPVYQPERVRAKEALDHIRACGAECAAVVAYGQILSQAFLDAHPLGALNVHASLLPRHRGAAPIHRSILAGDALTGVSIMLLDAGMDTGPVLTREELPIREDDTFLTLHDKLAEMGAALLCETLKKWKAGLLQPRTQDEALATYAPPLRKEEWRIAWHLSAERIVNTIRAFDPWPGAFAFYEGKRVKCFNGSLLHWSGQGKAGEIIGLGDKGLVVLAGDKQALSIGELQLEGQRRLRAADFLRGRNMPAGSCFE
jgi:methionyl-tRNA formyltransferase